MGQQIHTADTIQSAGFTRYGIITAVCWSLLIIYSIIWDHLQHQKEALLLGMKQAQAFFEKDVLYRRWASRHGGVYVPVTEATQPNPYLKHIPERDITTPSGRQLTLMNPAYMTRQVFEMAQEYKGTGRGHITSLTPIRHENAPDIWEKEALLAFARGAKEIGQIEHIDGKPYYRYMKALITDKPCLKCHQSQGYKEGDIRGGLSVSVEMDPVYDMMASEMRGVYINHGVIWFLGLGVIGFGTRKLRVKSSSLYEKTLELELEIEEHKVSQEALQEQAAVLEEEITERRQLEEQKLLLERQYQQTQKLESLGVLAGGIAHDFNNILTIIKGYCTLVKMDYESSPDHIPEIEKAVERAAELCRQMLTYAGKAQSSQSQVNLRMLVVEMVNMLKSTLSKKADISFECLTDIPFIKADASQLRQIIMNLIINASEAIGGAQGLITVSLAKVKLSGGKDKDYHGNAIPQGDYVCLEVSDNGCGMDDETKQRIFEPFYSTKFTGRGLGMSAVLGIITAHSGAIQLSSKAGHGSTFKVYLPLLTGNFAEEHLLQQISPEQWQGKGTILLVEDEEQIKMVATIMLKALGFSVIEASNGKEAIDKYMKNSSILTLVLTDIGMPVMDGYELLREIKKLDPALPVIISSGFGETVVSSQIAQGDIVGLVNKPYDFNQLREILKNATLQKE